MVSTSGARLLRDDAVDALERLLLPLADVVTPNLHEAAALVGGELAENEAAMRRQGEALLRRGARAVLVKGGHGEGAESVDILVDEAGARRFTAPRIATRNTHGTGCALSAAIAAELAKGAGLAEAVATAKAYLTGALAAGAGSRIGAGAGPPDHFHALRPHV
jgi:hydroxymethylpyrimidine/phosphomethylpyrimidine kinase